MTQIHIIRAKRDPEISAERAAQIMVRANLTNSFLSSMNVGGYVSKYNPAGVALPGLSALQSLQFLLDSVQYRTELGMVIKPEFYDRNRDEIEARYDGIVSLFNAQIGEEYSSSRAALAATRTLADACGEGVGIRTARESMLAYPRAINMSLELPKDGKGFVATGYTVDVPPRSESSFRTREFAL